MSFDVAQKIADAVLYEGYVLYPYRASAIKNRFRWQFGVLVPREYSERGSGEPCAMQTECLLEHNGEGMLDLRVRCLQLQARTIEAATGEPGVFRLVERVRFEGGGELVSWDEGLERCLDCTSLPLAQLLDAEYVASWDLSGGRTVELVRDSAGAERARIVREHWPIAAVVRISAHELDGMIKIRVRIENVTPWRPELPEDRNLALRQSLNGAHTLLQARNAAFMSMLEPPPAAAAAVAECENLHTWPVLVGPPGSRDVVLSSPIILYDHPAVAPESPGNLFDSTEIDEILTLRIQTLTDEEKRAARATDERARQIIDRSDAMPAAMLDGLHGTIRSLEGAAAFFEAAAPPEEDSVEIGTARVHKGSRVRLRPQRRADAMDMFLAGQIGRVEGIYRSVDAAIYVAVTVEGDPAAELHGWYGRYFYFFPDELEAVDSDAATVVEDNRRK
jgi:hypothetical protein